MSIQRSKIRFATHALTCSVLSSDLIRSHAFFADKSLGDIESDAEQPQGLAVESLVALDVEDRAALCQFLLRGIEIEEDRYMAESIVIDGLSLDL